MKIHIKPRETPKRSQKASFRAAHQPIAAKRIQEAPQQNRKIIQQKLRNPEKKEKRESSANKIVKNKLISVSEEIKIKLKVQIDSIEVIH